MLAIAGGGLGGKSLVIDSSCTMAGLSSQSFWLEESSNYWLDLINATEKPASMHTTRRHTFHHQMIAEHIDLQFDKYWCWKLLGLVLLWLVSEACQTSMSACVAFKWLHIPLANRQLAVIHHTTGWWIWPFSCFVWYVEVKMAPMDAIRLVLVKT